MGCGMMPMMYTGMQQYMPHMAMGMGMGMGMNGPPPPPHHHHHHHHPFMPFPSMVAAQRPLPPQTHMSSVSDPSRVYLPNQQFDPTSSQPQYPPYMDPYQQFRSIHPAQQPQFQVPFFFLIHKKKTNAHECLLVFVLEESSNIVPELEQGKK